MRNAHINKSTHTHLNKSIVLALVECVAVNNLIKKQLLNGIVRERRRWFHDDVGLKLNIAIDNVYWLKRWLSTSIHPDRSDLTGSLHYQQLWLRQHYCKSKRREKNEINTRETTTLEINDNCHIIDTELNHQSCMA